MKKTDIYKIRLLFYQINHDYTNDIVKQSDGFAQCRATKIKGSTDKGIEICNEYINKMQPIKHKKL